MPFQGEREVRVGGRLRDDKARLRGDVEAQCDGVAVRPLWDRPQLGSDRVEYWPYPGEHGLQCLACGRGYAAAGGDDRVLVGRLEQDGRVVVDAYRDRRAHRAPWLR